jgi:hypothetical protein
MRSALQLYFPFSLHYSVPLTDPGGGRTRKEKEEKKDSFIEEFRSREMESSLQDTEQTGCSRKRMLCASLLVTLHSVCLKG